jgi:hypothetical protein
MTTDHTDFSAISIDTRSARWRRAELIADDLLRLHRELAAPPTLVPFVGLE